MRQPTFALAATMAALLSGAQPALAWELDGTKQVALETRSGEVIPIGAISFSPAGEKIAFKLDLNTARFKDFFLSMREFKCLEGDEIQCYVPYPYANPRTISGGDLGWLETSLIFMFKTNTQFGATLANGLYYPLTQTPDGLVGEPHLVDLNQIAAPPDDPAHAPFPADERIAIEGPDRWIARLTIR